jgi:hypothetical protein
VNSVFAEFRGFQYFWQKKETALRLVLVDYR